MKLTSKLKKIKIAAPQIIAAFFVSTSYGLVGMCTAYSAILIPQLKDGAEKLGISERESWWIVSCITLVPPVFYVCGGLLADRFGRLSVLKLSAIPNAIGWILIALAPNGTLILIGRIFTGIGYAWGSIPCFVYISETSTPNVRGALLAYPAIFFSLGVVVIYVMGFFTTWRVVAWLALSWSVVSAILILFIPESPTWLVSRKRLNDAKKSLQWFNKYDTQKQPLSQDELETIQEEQKANAELCNNAGKLKMFAQPIGFKPFVILTVLFFIQQFSGINIITMNAIDFFKEIGTEFDPYLASTYMATARLVISVSWIWLMQKYSRRSLLIVSGAGMSISMAISGLYTNWIQNGTTDSTWVPLCMLISYFLFMAGILSLPFSLTGELFPLPIRGIASNLILSIFCLLMFGALQSYAFLPNLLGGLFGLQYFFAVIAAVGVVFIIAFVPETQNKKLSEIEEYFWSNTVYISCCKNTEQD